MAVGNAISTDLLPVIEPETPERRENLPLADGRFERLMGAFAPFEDRPRLAVALSGGADSLALCLLLASWTRRRSGQMVALTVDHGLRQNSIEEALRVAGWMAAWGIQHHILDWSGPKPHAGVQEAARRARYELLTAWCRQNGVLHLCFGHHREDQAETVVMRLSRGSGEDGLAGMSALVETPDLRILRPLLPVPRERLKATLTAMGQPWIEDPSNENRAFSRVRTRLMLPRLAELGLPMAGWSGLADRLGERRATRERETARLLARACVVHALGYALIDREALATAELDISLRALARVITTIGGGDYAPARAKVLRAYENVVAGGRATTLGRCRFVACRGEVLVCRESRHLPPPMPIDGLERTFWDGRFAIEFAVMEGVSSLGRPVRLAAVGRQGWDQLAQENPALRDIAVPYPARIVLPALWDSLGIQAIPGLYSRPGAVSARRALRRIVFRPANPLSACGFCLAPRDWSII